jgi:sugar phosphate isomerase/epimerase
MPALYTMGKFVDHMHIDDSSGRSSDHLEPGKGTIDFSAMTDDLRSFPGTINIELKICGDDCMGPILRSREYLLRLIEG